jgi:hypothetical protein
MHRAAPEIGTARSLIQTSARALSSQSAQGFWDDPKKWPVSCRRGDGPGVRGMEHGDKGG